MMRRIAGIELDDGVVFDVSGATAHIIRDEDEYSGVRVSMRCALAQACITFHIDVNVGDPVWPAPEMVHLPGLLEGSVQLRGYPIEAVLAEKVVTAGQRGTVNTRWRDFADIYLLRARHDVDGTALMISLGQVAHHRSAELGPLEESLTGYADLAPNSMECMGPSAAPGRARPDGVRGSTQRGVQVQVQRSRAACSGCRSGLGSPSTRVGLCRRLKVVWWRRASGTTPAAGAR